MLNMVHIIIICTDTLNVLRRNLPSQNNITNVTSFQNNYCGLIGTSNAVLGHFVYIIGCTIPFYAVSSFNYHLNVMY